MSLLVRWSKLPPLYWILIGFLASYLLIFIRTTFLNIHQQYLVPGILISTMIPIGIDLRWIVEYSRTWMQFDAIHTGYTPFTTVFFMPFAALEEQGAYVLITFLTALAFTFITLVFPHWFKGEKKLSPLLVGLLGIGLSSYGLYFELERGQFNTLAMLFCCLAIIIFRLYPRWRWLAYALFCIAAQLKLYPLIFVVFLIDDWRAWRTNFLRIMMLGMANIAALFILGVPMFEQFLQALNSVAGVQPAWVVNHSMVSYLNYTKVLPNELHLTAVEIIMWLVLALLSQLFWLYQRKTIFTEATLFLVCLITAFIIPTLSYDYKFSILGMGVGLFFLCFTDEQHWQALNPIQQLLHGMMLMLMMFVYTITLYSEVIKPNVFDHSLPLLLVLMGMGVMLNALLQRDSWVKYLILLVFGWLLLRFVLLIVLDSQIPGYCQQFLPLSEKPVPICAAYFVEN